MLHELFWNIPEPKRFTMRVYSLITYCLILLGFTVIALGMPWTQDMVRGPAILPQERPLLPPIGAISVDGELILDRIEAEEKLVNPLQVSAQVREQGEWLYEVYCSVCHGPEGEGNGSVGAEYFSKQMPSLSAPFIQEYADGYMYSIIREGGYLMPGYAEVMSQRERWMLVHYLRSFSK